MTRFKWNLVVAITFVFLNVILIPIAILLNHDSVNFYLCLIPGVLLPFIIPIASLIFKKDWPVILEVIIAVQSYFGTSFASAFDLYQGFKYYDLILHGLFGIEGTLFGYYILVLFGGKDLSLIKKCFILFMFVLGCAALWEIVEFVFSRISGNDVQHVFDPQEKDGVSDTMWDIIIASITSFVTLIIFIIDKICSGHMLELLNKSLEKEEEKTNV